MSCQTEDGLSPLHVAAMWGKQEHIRILLDYGADPLICDNEDLIPADHARKEGKVKCSVYILRVIMILQLLIDLCIS